MKGTPRAAALLVLAFACTLAWPGEAPAFPAAWPAGIGATRAGPGFAPQFFPAFWVGRESPSGKREADFIWPFGLWQASPTSGTTLFAIHPFFSAGPSSSTTRFWDVLYPLAGGRVEDQLLPHPRYYDRQWVLPLWYHSLLKENNETKRTTLIFPFIWMGSSDPPGGSHFIFFPFIWNIEPKASFYIPFSTPSPGSTFAIIPIYGRFLHMFGGDETTTILWPLYVRSTVGMNVTNTLLWPLLSETSGPEIHAWRVWPFAGYKWRAGVGEEWTYLWPLGHIIDRRAVDDKPGLRLRAFFPFYFNMLRAQTHSVYYFPAYGRDDSPHEHSTSWFWPIWKHTVHTDPDYTEDRFLFFVGHWKKGPDGTTNAFIPFFSDEREKDSRRFSFFYPIFSNYSDTYAGGDRFERQYAIPFFIHEKYLDAQKKVTKENLAVIPLFRSVKRGDGSSEFSWPHLWWYTDDAGMLRNWAPLWTLYASHNDGHGTIERDAFWRLYRSRTVAGQGKEWEFNFLIGGFAHPLSGPNTLSLLGFKFPLGRAPAAPAAAAPRE